MFNVFIKHIIKIYILLAFKNQRKGKDTLIIKRIIVKPINANDL